MHPLAWIKTVILLLTDIYMEDKYLHDKQSYDLTY